MEGYIKYERFCIKIKEDKIQTVFDDLVTRGYDIVYYNERTLSQEPYEPYEILLTIVGGKRQNRIL